MKDEVLEELWAIKDEIAKEHGYDLHALVAHLQKSPDPREQLERKNNKGTPTKLTA